MMSKLRRPAAAFWLFAVFAVLVLPAMIALSACGLPMALAAGNLPVTPAAVADRTVIDEKVMISAEEGYLAIGAAVEAAVDAGLLKGARAARIDQLDGRAKQALDAMRLAYAGGNASSFYSAYDRFKAAFNAARTLLPKRT